MGVQTVKIRVNAFNGDNEIELAFPDNWEVTELHQYGGRFGTDYGGRGYTPRRMSRGLEKASRTIVLAPHLSRNDRDAIGTPDQIVWHKTWPQVLAELASRHGPGTRVAVYPYAAVQVPSSVIAKQPVLV